MSIEKPTPGSYFPSSDNSDIYAKRLGGYDLYKSNKSWLAIVAIQDQYGKRAVKLYRWQKRISGWRNTLCNMKIDYLDFILISEKVKILKEKFGISGDSNSPTLGNNDDSPDDDSSSETIQISENNDQDIPAFYKYKPYAGYDGDFNHCDGRRKP